MSPKNKKKANKKTRGWVKNQSQDSKMKQSSSKCKEQQSILYFATEENVGNVPYEKERCLNIIEQTVAQLKGGFCENFIGILEKIILVFSSDLCKRSDQLYLIELMLSNISKYGSDELPKLDHDLNTPFFTRELNGYLVECHNLYYVNNISLLTLLTGYFTRTGWLEKGRTKTKVCIMEPCDRESGLQITHEAKILSRLSHDNIGKLLAFDGTYSRSALEYMKIDLSDALHEFRFTDNNLLDILKQVASGMAYIEEKGYVLRVLCTENILLTASGKCKIVYFRYCQYVGDSNGIYVDKNASHLIYNYSAPELKQLNRFSTKSDVWNMGLLVWEIYSGLRGRPLALTLEEFGKGGTLHKTERLPALLWAYFNGPCLCKNPDVRPTFVEMVKFLESFSS